VRAIALLLSVVYGMIPRPFLGQLSNVGKAIVSE
jgi:hypothetical protein